MMGDGRAAVQARQIARVALAVAVLVTAATACSGDKEKKVGSATTSTSSRSTSAPSTTTTRAPIDTTLGWTRLPGRLPDASNLNGVTAWKDGFIAVGVNGVTKSAAIWSSSDGTSWTQLKVDPTVFPAMEFPTDIATDGSRLVIVGFLNDSLRGRPRAWTSTNGTDWQRAQQPSFPAQATGLLSQVGGGKDGFVSILSGPEGATLVTTRDGSTWDVRTSTIAGSDPSTGVADVVAGGPGYVAVGSTGSPSDAAAWTSSDGNRWTRSNSADLGGERFQSASTAAVTEFGLVAAGSTNTGQTEDAAVWTSPDGKAWTLVSKDAAVFGGPTGEGIDRLTNSNGTLLAAGRGGAGGQPTFGAWTSKDGTTWSKAKTSAALTGGLIPQVTGIAATNTRAVAVARLMRPNPSTGRFDVADLAVFVGPPR